MFKRKGRTTVQIIVYAIVGMCLTSEYIPLVITAYLAIMHTLLDVFHYVGKEERRKELNPEGLVNTSVELHPSGKENFWPQTITAVIFQLLSLGAAFGLTWYLFEKKLNLI